MQDSEKHYSNSRPAFDYGNDSSLEEGSLASTSFPPHGLRNALGIGILGGLLTVVISIGTTLSNTSLFRTAASQGDNMSLGTAQTILGLSCLNYTLALLVAFGVGFLVGKKSVRRLYGFYAGALVGAVSYIGGIVLQYIPNYPGRLTNTATASSTTASGILLLVVFVLVWALIGALISLWGTQTATRKHPYYLAKKAQQEVE
ncbi:hypothetical protein [Dictyobacter arantiisoli]|uniref:Uncharacterized protein n=1 Tax=Dictyobacter arantiisoli TaxID=2014874 RepID=A0A5A5TEA2_9CHLR|nr:hypothetical protein [Dictyobacter arantiisoli]GCF09880.1 hypothetical protein KDI_34440 [Dictyobacter arantiisoli]